MVVFLIGYMGCGKSSIGRTLARRLGWVFADMDKEIEQQAGMSVAEIFAAHGEPWFRQRERETVGKLAEQQNIIVATGGGVPVHGDNMQRMNDAGLTIYFRMSPAKLVQRLEHGRDKRPLIRDLNDEQLLAFIQEKLPEREQFYSRSRLIIECDWASDDAIVDMVARSVEQAQKNKE